MNFEKPDSEQLEHYFMKSTAATPFRRVDGGWADGRTTGRTNWTSGLGALVVLGGALGIPW